jgi:hypothetical protein
MLERLLTIAVEDRALDRVVLHEVMQCLDSSGLRHGRMSALYHTARSRLAAEDWHASLVGIADSRGGAAPRKVEVARLILGHSGRAQVPRVDRATLKARLDEYQVHEQWLRDRIDPAWICNLEKSWRRREIGLYGLYTLVAIAVWVVGEGLFITFARDLPGWLMAVMVFFPFLMLWILKRPLSELWRLISPLVAEVFRAALATTPIRRARAFVARLSAKDPRNVA